MPKDNYYLPARRLVSQDDSAIIADPRVPRSQFLNRWSHVTAFDTGYLVPFLVEPILPGDHMRYDVSAYLRLSTLLFPNFSNLRVDTFFFFVPNRLVWTNWVRFMGEQPTPTAGIDYLIPTCTSPVGGYAVGSLQDHMGLPTVGQLAAGQQYTHSALPLRAYNLIYDTWFRDQNVIDGPDLNTGDGPDDPADYVMERRAKAHDYFTSALPWPQKFTAPTVPVGGLAPVKGIGIFVDANAPTSNTSVLETDGSVEPYTPGIPMFDANSGFYAKQFPAVADRPAIYADLSQATGTAINTLRQAFMVQTLLERDARGGTRYVELIRSHFGVTNPDFRLQRPEYIGGGQTPLAITPIAQTAPTEDAPLGALGAAGTAAGQHKASYAATEHGYIIGLINIRSETLYQQGVARHWNYQTRLEHYFPELAHLGEQTILRREIYATGQAANDLAVFGYQERWHEYRTRTSEVTGIMRSTAAGTLDAWHLAQRFTAAPLLNESFLVDNPPMTRILAAGELAFNQQLLADIELRRTAVRPLPTFGTPTSLGRF